MQCLRVGRDEKETWICQTRFSKFPVSKCLQWGDSSAGGLWGKALRCMWLCLYVCVCVWQCEWVNEKRERENKGDFHKLTYWFPIWKQGWGFGRERIGRWSHWEKRGDEVERKHKKWSGRGRAGDETDDDLKRGKLHTHVEEVGANRGRGWWVGAWGLNLRLMLGVEALEMLIAQLWHRKWLWVIDKGRWGWYASQRTAGLKHSTASLSPFHLSVYLYHFSIHLTISSVSGSDLTFSLSLCLTVML